MIYWSSEAYDIFAMIDKLPLWQKEVRPDWEI